MSSPLPAQRYDRLDVLRGVAIVWMAAFHFAFDLNHFGLVARQDFYRDPLWTWQRTAIVTLFLCCAGIGQLVAWRQGQTRRRFVLRWLQIVDCALLVSVASAVMFPRSWISFGVLHAIAVMVLLLRWMAPLMEHRPWVPWALGALGLALPWWVSHPFFDSRLTNWVGLVTRKPVTEDFVPILPWLGVICWGWAAGRWMLDHHPGWIVGAVPRWTQPLAVLGRWSLSFYMLHQPILIGAVLAYLHLRR